MVFIIRKISAILVGMYYNIYTDGVPYKEFLCPVYVMSTKKPVG